MTTGTRRHPGILRGCYAHGVHYMTQTGCAKCISGNTQATTYERCKCIACDNCSLCDDEDKRVQAFTDQELASSVELRSKTLDELNQGLF